MMELITMMDQAAAGWFGSVRTGGLTLFFQWITQLGSAAAIISLSVIILIFLGIRRNWPDFKIFFFTVLGGELVNESLKWLFHRGRPPHPWLTTASGFSFPSGHSLMSTIFYLCLAWLIWRHLPQSTKRTSIVSGLITVPILVGISRIYLGVHFLTDVLGGWVIGCIWISYITAIWKHYHYDLND